MGKMCLGIFLVMFHFFFFEFHFPDLATSRAACFLEVKVEAAITTK
jgi:hypothetical protein